MQCSPSALPSTCSALLTIAVSYLLFSAAVDLFRRTVALITAPGAALSAMPFVPRGAFVILLAPHSTPSNVQDPREQKGRVHRAAAVEHHPEVMRAVRGLARAAGLHLAVVACPVESVGSDSDGTPGAPEMVCGTQALADAVSWAASQVCELGGECVPRTGMCHRLRLVPEGP